MPPMVVRREGPTRVGEPAAYAAGSPPKPLPRVQDDVVACPPQQADHVAQPLGVDPLGEDEAVVDVLFERLQRPAPHPRAAGGGHHDLSRPGRPAALPAPAAAARLPALLAVECALDVRCNAPNALGDVDVGIQCLVLLEDLVVTRHVEQMLVLRVQPFEYLALALAGAALCFRHEGDSTTPGGMTPELTPIVCCVTSRSIGFTLIIIEFGIGPGPCETINT